MKIRNRSIATLLAIPLTIAMTAAHAEEKEPTAIIGIGGVAEWGLPGGVSGTGPSASLEFSVIKDWLEIEISGARMHSSNGTGWDGDLTFKKPFNLSKNVEFMIGAGPARTYSREEGSKWGATFVADFMIWPQAERRLGWFVEPSYTTIKAGEKSFGIRTGVLIALY